MDVTIEQVRKAYEPELMATEGVVGVGHVGEKIRIYVEGTPDFPETIAGYPTEIVKVGHIRALPLLAQEFVSLATDRTGRVRPCPGGMSCGSYKITAGTLGCAIQIGERLYGLSNNHVLADGDSVQKPTASLGDEILAPGAFDGGTIKNDMIGRLFSWVPLDQVNDNLVDMGIFEPINQEDLSREILEVGEPTGFGQAYVGERVRKSGRCFTEDTLIQTNPEGPKTVKELQAGNQVYAYDEETGRIVKAGIRQVISQGLREVFRVRTRNRTVEVTENHPFLVATKKFVEKMVKVHCKFFVNQSGRYPEKEYEKKARVFEWNLIWKALQDIRLGDLIVTLHHLDGHQNVDPDYARLLGFFIGDGGLNIREGEGGNIALYCASREEAEHYGQLMEKVFNETVKEFECGRCKNVFKSISGSTCPKCYYRHNSVFSARRRQARLGIRKNCFIAHYYSTKAAKAFQTIAGGKKLNKRIPMEVWDWDRESRLQFLEGYCDADGHRYQNYSKGKSRVYAFGSPNERLIKEIRALHISCGLRVTNVYSRVKKGYNTNIIWEFKSYPDNSKKKANTGCTVKGRRAEHRSGMPTVGIPENLQLESVVGIEPLGIKPTFDIEVEGQHNFIGDGILLHNTSGLTTGIVQDIDATITVDYGGFEATFIHQIMTSYMADGGDSGSALIDEEELTVVGLLYSGSEFVTCHNHINPVLQALDVGPRALGAFPWSAISFAPLGALALYLIG